LPLEITVKMTPEAMARAYALIVAAKGKSACETIARVELPTNDERVRLIAVGMHNATRWFCSNGTSWLIGTSFADSKVSVWDDNDQAMPKSSSLDDVVVMPRYLVPPAPVYPPALQAKCISGTVMLRVMIKSGKADDISVLKTSGYVAFDDAAIAAARGARWESKPEPVSVRLPINFAMRGC
jgi:TonB family protein